MHTTGHRNSFRRIIRWMLLLGCMMVRTQAVVLVPEPRAPYAGPPRPNVVLYLIDTLRADHLGTYGYGRDSPHIDQWAQGALVFETAIAPDTCTLGSTPSLMSGQTTVRHGVDTFGKQVDPNLPLLSSLLNEAGYATGSFITNINAGPTPGLDRGFDHVHDAIKTFKDSTALRTLPFNPIQSWLTGLDERPFFLYVHTSEPHRPYTPRALQEPIRNRIQRTHHGCLSRSERLRTCQNPSRN